MCCQKTSFQHQHKQHFLKPVLSLTLSMRFISEINAVILNADRQAGAVRDICLPLYFVLSFIFTKKCAMKILSFASIL